jgi:predicted nucleic acid-binding protein
VDHWRNGSIRSFARLGTRHRCRTRAKLWISIRTWQSPADPHCATIRHGLEQSGTLIGQNDMLIAEHALDAMLVSDNLREFDRVAGLQMEKWVR